MWVNARSTRQRSHRFLPNAKNLASLDKRACRSGALGRRVHDPNYICTCTYTILLEIAYVWYLAATQCVKRDT